MGRSHNLCAKVKSNSRYFASVWVLNCLCLGTVLVAAGGLAGRNSAKPGQHPSTQRLRSFK
jgi:hypothetical protein